MIRYIKARKSNTFIFFISLVVFNITKRTKGINYFSLSQIKLNDTETYKRVTLICITKDTCDTILFFGNGLLKHYFESFIFKKFLN